MSKISGESDTAWCEEHKRKKRMLPSSRGLDLRREWACNVCEYLARMEAQKSEA